MPEQDSQLPAEPTEESTKDDADTGEGAENPVMTKKQVETYFKTRIASSKRVRKTMIPEWRRNVELRIGHVATLYTGGLDVQDEIQSEINPDWWLTKTKTANLFSQVPTIRLKHENKQYAPALPPFAKALNYEISPKRANVGVAMEEMLNDLVNAAGIGAIHVGYAARFQDKLVPVLDPQQMAQIPPDVASQLTETEVDDTQPITPDIIGNMLMQRQMPMKRVPEVVSDKIFAKRISPVDLVTPSEFTGSNFDDGDFIGYDGRCSWPEAQAEFKLKDDQYSKCVGQGGENNPDETLRANAETRGLMDVKSVKYTEIYYWRARVDPEEKHFDCIWRIVYVEGLDEPPIHEAWTGQKLVGKNYIGNRRFPIRVCTLTYITDNPIPPSDSSAGRPQVNDMRRSRRDMFNNRERSIPIRWFDVNRIDQTIQELLMQGRWQGMIPTNGDGSRSIGEIARASYPSENLAFDQQVQADLNMTWQVGPNQVGSQSKVDETAAAANITQQNFATRIGQERNRVLSCFVSVAEAIAGFMVLYSEFPSLTDQEKQVMQQAWDQKSILADLAMTILPDSQIVLDSAQRVQKITNAMNITVKSGYVNPKPLITEIFELSGIDPYEVVVDPQPKKEDPNISYRFSGKDDLMSPIVVAMLIKAGEFPSEDEIKEAQKRLLAAQAPPEPEIPGAEQAPGSPNGAPLPPPGGAPQPGPKPMPPTQLAHPDWHLASKVAQRSRDTEA